MEKTCVLDELLSDKSDRAVGCEFNVNKTTVYTKGVFKEKHT